tara:strand:+ start:872 stop:1288 length:417 start_codon:yes stop_codon:yes gene_type:complete
MSKRGDKTGREELRKLKILDMQKLMSEPGLTSSERKMVQDKIKKLKAGGNPLSAEFELNAGGDVTKKKKKVPVIAISVGMAEMPKDKKGPMKMAMGGMANGKKHMYLNEGALVTENLNPGLKALAKERPDVVKKILKK